MHRTEERLYEEALRFLHHPQGYKSKKEVKQEAKLKKKLNKQYRNNKPVGLLSEY